MKSAWTQTKTQEDRIIPISKLNLSRWDYFEQKPRSPLEAVTTPDDQRLPPRDDPIIGELLAEPIYLSSDWRV